MWAEFRESLDETNGFRPWMYGPGDDDRPSDLGYWIGKRIASAYYARAADKSRALADLLRLENPRAILTSSGYDPG